ncbi:MAG: hypothetical protein J5I94_25305 [Phaeodactylibacter sp.]|nr:hypothetical protein [Phaeodactylibacter sp.]
MQFAIFGLVDTTLNFIPGTGMVIKVFADGSRDTLTTGLIGLNPNFIFDASGNLYATDRSKNYRDTFFHNPGLTAFVRKPIQGRLYSHPAIHLSSSLSSFNRCRSFFVRLAMPCRRILSSS